MLGKFLVAHIVYNSPLEQRIFRLFIRRLHISTQPFTRKKVIKWRIEFERVKGLIFKYSSHYSTSCSSHVLRQRLQAKNLHSFPILAYIHTPHYIRFCTPSGENFSYNLSVYTSMCTYEQRLQE